MASIFETITKRLVQAWRSDEPSGRGNAYRCDCGRPVYFRNSLCLGCKSALGFEPDSQQVRAISPGSKPDTWRLTGTKDAKRLWRRCKNFDSPAGCNWLVSAKEKSRFAYPAG